MGDKVAVTVGQGDCSRVAAALGAHPEAATKATAAIVVTRATQAAAETVLNGEIR